MAASLPHTTKSLATTVELSVAGRGLRDMDVFSKSDPMCVLYKKEFGQLNWVEHGRTETIWNDLNPKFVKKFVLDYHFEEKQYLKFKLYDIDAKSADLSRHDYLGEMECSLGMIISSMRLEEKLTDSDPLIGEVQTSFRNLTRGTGIHNEYKLINPKKKEKQSAKYKHSGILKLDTITISNQYHFIDFIQAGCEIKVSVAVDFSKSNGDPSSPTSLHYHVPGGAPNPYARALTAVVDILLDYDSDKKIPAFGFAAIPGGRSEPSDLFPLNGNASNPDCDGLEGVLDAYRNSLQTAKLYGPTRFAPAINYVAKQASSYTNGEEYHILLLLTDGIIDDMPDTKQAIVSSSNLPLSIIIVGLGKEDFRPMHTLDGDHERISYKKEVAARDIVQFVAFRDFDHQGMSSEVKGRMLLAKEVLAEVPEQLESYMAYKNIHPKRRHKLTYTMV